MSVNGTGRTADDEPDVMAAVEEDRLVIADVSRDDAWLAADLGATAADLSDWR